MNLIFVILVAIGTAMLFMHCVRESGRQMEEQVGFTAQQEISDEEFCELMPEVDPNVALKVRQVCADVSGWDNDEIHPNTRLIEFELW